MGGGGRSVYSGSVLSLAASRRAELTTGLEVGKGILETAVGSVGGDAALVTRTGGGGGRAVAGIGGSGDTSNAS